jgi:23S rRNA pseudouridine1911/1915/1917 synthase
MIVNENALLLDFLLKNMSEKSRNSVKSFLKHGQIVVNGKTVTRYDYPLKSGDKIIVGNHRSIVEKNIPQLRILYEDDDIIVIDKEAGLLTITTEVELIPQQSRCLRIMFKNNLPTIKYIPFTGSIN